MTSFNDHEAKLKRMPILQGLHDREWILKNLKRHPDSRILRKWLYEDVCVSGIDLRGINWL